MAIPVKSAIPETPLVLRCEGDDLVAVFHASVATLHSVGVVIVVGGPQYRVGSHRQFLLMAKDLARSGYPVLRFDYRGMGDSDGDARSFESVGADIRVAIDALLALSPNVDRVVLWGLCDAASAALLYCHSDKRVAGLVLANPWVRTTAGEARSYLQHYYLRRLLQRSFWHKVLSGGVRLRKSVGEFAGAVRDSRSGAANAPSFIERMLEGLRAFSGKVLVLISDRDLTAQEFMDRCREDSRWGAAMRRSNVRLEKLANADHTFSTRDALARATAVSRSWLETVA